MTVMNFHQVLAILSIYLLTIDNLIIISITNSICKSLVSTSTSILAELGPAQPQLVFSFEFFPGDNSFSLVLVEGTNWVALVRLSSFFSFFSMSLFLVPLEIWKGPWGT